MVEKIRTCFYNIEFMPKELNFAAPTNDSGANKEKPGIVYPPEIKAKLDKAMAQVVSAKTLPDINAALAEYQKKIKNEAKGFQLVKVGAVEIHSYEFEALQNIIREINDDYEEQRARDPRFDCEPVVLGDFRMEVRVPENNVSSLNMSSFNLTRIPPSIAKLDKINKLQLAGNSIRKIEHLGDLRYLRDLSMTGNQIREISGLDNCVSLNILSLSRNKINKIQNLRQLTKLESLGLTGNEIEKIEGLETLTQLAILYLQENRIARFENLDSLTRLGEIWLNEQKVKAEEYTEINAIEIERLKQRKVWVYYTKGL